MAIKTLTELISHLREHNVLLRELSSRQSFSITKQWTTVFGQESDSNMQIVGSKAIAPWLESDEEPVLLLLLSSKISAFPISSNHRPCIAFEYSGPKIDLSNYHELEFALFPKSYAWTLIHTHEDYAFGGPFFIRNDPFNSRLQE